MESQSQLRSFFTAEKDHYLFHFDLSPDSPPRRVDVALEARTRLEEALSIAIDAINAQLAKESLKLSEELTLYRPRLVGRNFRPKTDMPALALHQKICDLKVTEIAVQLLNREKALRPIVQSQQTHPDSNSHQALTAKAQPVFNGEKTEKKRKESGAAAVGDKVEREVARQEEKDAEIKKERGPIVRREAEGQQGGVEAKSSRTHWTSTTTMLAVKAAELSARAAQKAGQAAELACEAQQLASQALQLAIQAAQQTSWSA